MTGIYVRKEKHMNKDLIASIEAIIEQNGKLAGYENVVLTDTPADTPVVGIWWYLRGRVIKLTALPKDCIQEEMICVEQEHVRVFPFMQRKYAAEIPEILSVKYNQIERGRVWAITDPDNPTIIKKYMITCSTAFSKDYAAIAEVKKAFCLGNFTALVQLHACMYDLCEKKL